MIPQKEVHWNDMEEVMEDEEKKVHSNHLGPSTGLPLHPGALSKN